MLSKLNVGEIIPITIFTANYNLCQEKWHLYYDGSLYFYFKSWEVKILEF